MVMTAVEAAVVVRKRRRESVAFMSISPSVKPGDLVRRSAALEEGGAVAAPVHPS
jgi:hypothetical protein